MADYLNTEKNIESDISMLKKSKLLILNRYQRIVNYLAAVQFYLKASPCF